MTFRELSFKLSKIISKNTDRFNTDVVVHELIGGFMEDIEDVKLEEDPYTHKTVIAIQFRNQ